MFHRTFTGELKSKIRFPAGRDWTWPAILLYVPSAGGRAVNNRGSDVADPSPAVGSVATAGRRANVITFRRPLAYAWSSRRRALGCGLGLLPRETRLGGCSTFYVSLTWEKV